MSRIMIAVMPFTGHVSPLLAIARALRERGHEVRVYTGSAFESRVTRTGVRFVPWRAAPDFDENDLAATFPRLIGRKGLRQLFINLEDVMIGTAAAQADDLQAEWDREPWDLIVGDEMSFGAAFIAERTRSPWTTAAILPLNMAGTQGPPSGLGLLPGRNPATRARDALLRSAVPLLTRPLDRPLARARQSAGLAPADLRFDQAAFSSRLVLASGCSILDYARTDRPAHVRFVGELAAPDAAPAVLPAWWPDLEGRTVVHVTQGTQNIDPDDLIRPALEALADRDLTVVVSTGVRGRDELPFPVPPNARVAGFLPYADLLPRVDVMVTNGGWGGTVAALAHGIPLVIAGGDLDKPEIAARVSWAGAGVNLRTGTPTTRAVSRGVDQVLADPSFRRGAEKVRDDLRRLGGAERAAELIEGLAAAG